MLSSRRGNGTSILLVKWCHEANKSALSDIEKGPQVQPVKNHEAKLWLAKKQVNTANSSKHQAIILKTFISVTPQALTCAKITLQSKSFQSTFLMVLGSGEATGLDTTSN